MEITTDQQNEKQRSSVAILSLLSRIDRLETAMRHLEMKQSSSPSGCSTANTTFSPSSGVTSEQQLPVVLDLDAALKEASFKGALLERIKTLENRLFQLRLRVESEKMEAGRSRRDHHLLSSSCSFPIFMMNNNPNSNSVAAYSKQHMIPNTSSMIINNNNLETQQAILEATEEGEEGTITSCKEDEESIKSKLPKKKKKSNKESKNEQEKRRTKKKKKKAMSKAEREKIKSLNWPHFKILGC